MRKTYVLFVLMVSLGTMMFAQTLNLGTEEILENEFYVVHSSMNKDGSLFGTSNIYVIRGMQDSVWIFGTGYGDSGNLPLDTSDIMHYRGIEWDAVEDALFDAKQVDSVITNHFGMSRSAAKLQFLTPHYHLDHMNKEFVSAFVDSMNYPIDQARIIVHINDLFAATCNAKCCGLTPCNEENYLGTPFHPPWTTEILDIFSAIGTANDTCSSQLLSFNASFGMGTIVKGDTFHVQGALNIDFADKKYRILGSAPDRCAIGYDWKIFEIHGNRPVCLEDLTLMQSTSLGKRQARISIGTNGNISLHRDALYLAPEVELHGLFEMLPGVLFEIQPVGCQ